MTGAPAYPYRYAPNGDGASIGGGGGAKGSGASGGAVGGPCGACKFLRRKCVEECIFAPYFNCEKGQSNFAIVHRIFGSSNVSKLLARLPENHRMDACVSICYEAQARVRDPVYGCVAHILTLQQQVTNLQAEIAYLRAHLAPVQVPTPPPPPPPQPITGLPPPMVGLHSAPPSTFDLSSLFDPTVPTGLHPPFQGQGQGQVHSPMGPLRISFDDGASTSAVGSGSGSGSDAELQALARELLMQEPFDHVPHNGQSSSVPKSD